MSERAARTSGPDHGLSQFYRLMQFTLRDILHHGVRYRKPPTGYTTRPGELGGAGSFCKQLESTKTTTSTDSSAKPRKLLSKLKNRDNCRIEKADLEKIEFYVDGKLKTWIAQVCRCCEENHLHLRRGLHQRTAFRSIPDASSHVKEVDCWCSGDRVCRF